MLACQKFFTQVTVFSREQKDQGNIQYFISHEWKNLFRALEVTSCQALWDMCNHAMAGCSQKAFRLSNIADVRLPFSVDNACSGVRDGSFGSYRLTIKKPRSRRLRHNTMSAHTDVKLGQRAMLNIVSTKTATGLQNKCCLYNTDTQHLDHRSFKQSQQPLRGCGWSSDHSSSFMQDVKLKFARRLYVRFTNVFLIHALWIQR